MTRTPNVLLRLVPVAVPVGVGVLISKAVSGLPFALALALTFGVAVALYALLDAALVRWATMRADDASG